jgi:hypothetical protein
MRGLLAIAAAAAAFLAAAAPAAASVRLASVTSPAYPGSDATLVARVSSTSVTCGITVYYKSGPSRAKGVKPRKRPVGGRVSWTWRVGTNTTRGRWPIVVRCGSAGTLRTSFRVA